MNMEELFIDGHKLPRPLNKQEVTELLIKIKNWDLEAREKLVHHNIRLVLYQVVNRFKTVQYDQQELVGIGNLGLLKAVDTFDMDKGFEFTTYASRCIENEILMFLRKLKNDQIVSSLDAPINVDMDGHEQTLEDILSNDIDIEEDYVNNDVQAIVRSIVENMEGRDKEIVKMYFGFYQDHKFTQKEIAQKFNISQSYLSRVIKRLVKKLRLQLQEQGIVDLNLEKGDKSMAKPVQSIYDYFKQYSKEEINLMLSKLNEEERKLITLRYGDDLENPVKSVLWNKECSDKYYGRLMPKMKRLLANPTNEKKHRGRKPRQQNIEQTSLEIKTPNNNPVENVREELPIKSEALVASETNITKDSYVYMLEFLKSPIFSGMLNTLDPKSAMIVSLKLGYVDDKVFTNASIAEFLGISIQEVIDIVKVVLLDYKKRLNEVVEQVITVATTEDDLNVFTKKN